MVGLGCGGLVLLIYFDDCDFVGVVVVGIVFYHGCFIIGSVCVVEYLLGLGIVMLFLVYGGLGWVGGGEELGGMCGLNFYL